MNWDQYFERHKYGFDNGYTVRKRFRTSVDRGLSDKWVFKDPHR